MGISGKEREATALRQLSPELAQWLQKYNRQVQKMMARGFRPTSTNAREGLANLTSKLVKERVPVAWVQDDLVSGERFDVPVRIYHPQPESSLPLLIYLHGGGHMAGSVTVYDPICRRIARASAHIVVSVDYRLAPECPYPAGIDDALTVIRGIARTLAGRGVTVSGKLRLAGDSAGGSMCATLSHLLQHDSKVKIEKQILIYPCLDYTLRSASVSLNAEGYLLHRDRIEWYFNNYFRSREDRKTVSPLYMEFSRNIPESLVVTTEFCPLRDDGFRYLKRLQDAGVFWKHRHFTTMIHAFLNMEELVAGQCAELYREMALFLKGNGGGRG